MPASRLRPTPAGLVLGAASLALLLSAGAVLLDRAVGLPGFGPDCVVQVAGTDGGDERELSREQAQRLTTLAGVTRRDGLTAERLAVAARSALDGDTAGRAVEALARVPADRTPDPEDLALADALLGRDGAALTCTAVPSQVAPQPELASGLTARAEDLLAQVRLVFGRSSVGGFAPGGVDTGHIPGSAHYEGRAVDVFYRPITDQSTARGWTTAQWAVAHADELAIGTVIFDRLIWTAARAEEGWRPYRVPDRPGDPAVLAHEDHVHLDVLAGG